MKKAIIGKKVGMTQIFDETGKVIPVTVIEAGPCKVIQKKTNEKEGYTSVQLGFEDVQEKKLNKPLNGHIKKAGTSPVKYLKEFSLTKQPTSTSRRDLCDVFSEGDKVDYQVSAAVWVRRRISAERSQNTSLTRRWPVHMHAGSMGSPMTPQGYSG
jgi:large subunit ribosomal protein L3